MNAAINAASWVVGKALAPVADTVLEAWAASVGLSSNVKDLNTELLYVKAMLDPYKQLKGGEIHNPPLEALLQRLRDLADDSEDVLDELDYFRIQDELLGTSEAADEHPKGCAHNLILNTGHTAIAVAKQLLSLSACSSPPSASRRRARDTTSSPAHTNLHQADEVNGCMRKLTSGACNTIRDVGKRLPCSSLPHIYDNSDDSDDNSDDSNAPQRNIAEETPKLRFDRVSVSKRMKLILEQLRPLRHEVSEILRTLGPSWTMAPNIAQSRPITTSESIEPKLYGREDLMKSIIHDITQGKYCANNLTVLPIVGPGGIGKTTLAQHIYQNLQVQNHFDVKVWICVSLDFNVNKLTEEIEKYIPKVNDEKSGTTAELIGQRLKFKKFLLVLDDMWEYRNMDEWKRLLLPFKKSQVNGNIIMVTTRIPEVAQMARATDRSIELEGIDLKEFKKLFLSFVFDDEEYNKDHFVLLEIGDKIIDKLKGSPLAAKTVGKLLRNHLDLDHWTEVLESKEWELQNDKNDIMPALKLSYDYLPFHLQQCFSYCALFPQDYRFGSTRLIHFWIGLDILHSGDQSKRNYEDIGLRNLNDLVSHGFLKEDVTDRNIYYMIHDLLHDLALKVASRECFVVDHSNMRTLESHPSVRHLSINIYSAEEDDRMTDEFMGGLTKLSTRLKIQNLHTLVIVGKVHGRLVKAFSDLFLEANALRVLYLPEMSNPIESMIPNFSALIHLRYLMLGTAWWSPDTIFRLPSSISRLYHLRILDLQGWHGLSDLPSDMGNLKKLRHFLTMNDELHSGIRNVGKLQYLQELKRFQVNKESNDFGIDQLGNLSELRELGIYNLEKVHTREEATQARLINKNYLRKLTLHWDSERPNIEYVAEALILESLQPHGNIRELCISGHRGTYHPTWLGDNISVKALQTLHLYGVAWEVLPRLGLMSMLEELTLHGMTMLTEFGPHNFGCMTEHSFQNLRRLTLSGLKGLEKWVGGGTFDLFSLLQVLIIIDCPELLTLPLGNIIYPPSQDQERNQIHWFPNLCELKIERCPKLKSLPPIPWKKTLHYVEIINVGSVLNELSYYSYNNQVYLEIDGKEDLHNLDGVLAFTNLTNLHKLTMLNCPPLESKHLQMLASLRSITVKNQGHVFAQSKESEGGVEWPRLPCEKLVIWSCHESGKKLSQVLLHLPILSSLYIYECNNMTQIGVQHVDLQMDTVKEAAEVDDGLLLLPSHPSLTLKQLTFDSCQELTLMSSPLPSGNEVPVACTVAGHRGHANIHDRRKKDETEPIESNSETQPSSLVSSLPTAGGFDGVGVGLLALCTLQELHIDRCPKFFSAYKDSSCCLFPSSLQELWLRDVDMQTLEPLSNLTSLTILRIERGGKDLRGEGLWPLIARGQLVTLIVYSCPNLFLGSDPIRWLQDGGRSLKLQSLVTDDVAGVLVAPICTLLSSCLTKLYLHVEVERFTEEQEEALQLLTSLQDLDFNRCSKLQCLPAGLHTLPNLKKLMIYECPAMRSLPKEGPPSSLQEIQVNCHINKDLQQQLKKFIQRRPIKVTSVLA